jgi:hypothetical protein
MGFDATYRKLPHKILGSSQACEAGFFVKLSDGPVLPSLFLLYKETKNENNRKEASRDAENFSVKREGGVTT